MLDVFKTCIESLLDDGGNVAQRPMQNQSCVFAEETTAERPWNTHEHIKMWIFFIRIYTINAVHNELKQGIMDLIVNMEYGLPLIIKILIRMSLDYNRTDAPRTINTTRREIKYGTSRSDNRTCSTAWTPAILLT